MIGMARTGYEEPKTKAEIEDVPPETQKAIDATLASMRQKAEDAASAKEAEAAQADAVAEELRSPPLGKSPEEIEQFIRALKAAFGPDLDFPKLQQEQLNQYISNLAERFTVTTDLDTHVAGTPVRFQGQGANPASYDVTKDTITVAGGNFGPRQAKEMVALAALDKSMLKDGVDLTGNEYERSLIVLAIQEYNKENPHAKLDINNGSTKRKAGMGINLGVDGTAKKDWKAHKYGTEPASKIDPIVPPLNEEEAKDLGVLSEEAYLGLVDHVQKEGKATDKIIKDFLGSADIGEASIKTALADAKAALKTESFIEVVPHGKSERLKVNISGDFESAASGEAVDAAVGALERGLKNLANEKPAPGPKNPSKS